MVMPYDITECDKHLLFIGLEPEGTKINVECDGHYGLYSNNLLLASGHFFSKMLFDLAQTFSWRQCSSQAEHPSIVLFSCDITKGVKQSGVPSPISSNVYFD